jgi:hypothetical protein
MRSCPSGLVHAQGPHRAQVPMRQAPLDRVLHRPEDAVHEVRKIEPTSLQLSRLAQVARNPR